MGTIFTGEYSGKDPTEDGGKILSEQEISILASFTNNIHFLLHTTG